MDLAIWAGVYLAVLMVCLFWWSNRPRERER